jgi:soluble lytic murein transglycosylase-like protein
MEGLVPYRKCVVSTQRHAAGNKKGRVLKTYAIVLAVIVSALTLLTPLKAGAASAPYTSGGPHYTYYTPPRRPAPVYRPAPAPIYRRAPAYGGGATDAIAQASARWGVSYGWLLRVASCESGLNPGAYNPSGASGLFQFMPGTYFLYASQIGETRSYWDAYGAANVAGYMFSRGLSYQWTCR